MPYRSMHRPVRGRLYLGDSSAESDKLTVAVAPVEHQVGQPARSRSRVAAANVGVDPGKPDLLDVSWLLSA